MTKPPGSRCDPDGTLGDSAPDLAATGRALRRFREEVLLARRVTHANVCRIFDVFSHRNSAGGKPVMVLAMELLEGETLARKLARDGSLGVDEARPLILQLVEALAAAHRAGVVHLDFKSANVMLVPSPGGARAVVMDFGLARSTEASDRSPRWAVGTPGYMAPEVRGGSTPTPAADLFSLGRVCQEI